MMEYFTEFNPTELFKATMVLFAVIDIVGSVPLSQAASTRANA